MNAVKDLDLNKIGKEVLSFVKTAPAAVTTKDEYDAAASWLVSGRLRLKEWDAKFERIAKPMREALQELRNHKAELLKHAQEYFDTLDQRMMTWLHEERVKADAEQKKQMDRYEKKVAQAEVRGKSVDAIPLPPVAPIPSTSVLSEHGKLVTRDKTLWRLAKHKEVTSVLVQPKTSGGQGLTIFRTDPRFADLPDSCWELNPSRAMESAKAAHPAFELFTVPVTVVTTN